MMSLCGQDVAELLASHGWRLTGNYDPRRPLIRVPMVAGEWCVGEIPITEAIGISLVLDGLEEALRLESNQK